jgi:hypothetical protein
VAALRQRGGGQAEQQSSQEADSHPHVASHRMDAIIPP